MEVIEVSAKVVVFQNIENVISLDIPYRVRRTTFSHGNIVWYGINTNWRRVENQWYELKEQKWVPCEEPEYEKLYKEIAWK